MLGRSPEEVARFLAKSSGLNKTMIGEYLGEREDGCLKVMHAYVNAIDFAGVEFDVAIRWVHHVCCRAGCMRGFCWRARLGADWLLSSRAL